ncbi:MAG: AhpC/TSA family protein [Tannerella sp.]|jgi:thiol-disulfide isomerase/thioredoxin|nr:AhpC/TSA family protein [Tannerella sp.]
MRKLFYFAVLIGMAVLNSCDGGKNSYTVNGSVNDSSLDGQMVLMTDYNSGQVIDSVIIANGKFVFKGIADSAKVCNLRAGDLFADIILDKGTLTLDMADPLSAKGNPLTEQLNEFISKSNDISSKLQEEYMDMEGSEDDLEAQERIIDDFATKMNALSDEYLKDHSNDMLGAIVFLHKMQNQVMPPSQADFEAMTQGLGETILNFGPVKQMAEVYEKLGKTAEGQMFTDFAIDNGNPDGTPAKFSDYIGKGKYVLVDFWASWCGPCLRELPNLKEVYAKYKGDKFDILGVAVWDKREDTMQSIEEHEIKWNQIIDAQTVPTDIYGIQGIPHIILFAPDGTIVARELRGQRIGEKIAEVLAQK